MKTKLVSLITGLALIGISNASVLLNYSYDSGAIVALVNEYNGVYQYHYTFNKQEFTHSTQDLSHFEFAVCSNFTISNIQTNGITIGSVDQTPTSFKFDDISDEQPNTFWASFESPNSPKFGNITIKYGQNIETISTITPSCNVIPEPGSILLGGIGILLLLNRRNRNV